jgi:hypothetical protein
VPWLPYTCEIAAVPVVDPFAVASFQVQVFENVPDASVVLFVKLIVESAQYRCGAA